MGFENVLEATPAVESANWKLGYSNFLEGALIEVNFSKLEPVALL
jgi:hypothetical protein